MCDWLARPVRQKLRTFDESGMGYWIVTVTLRDGKRYRNVFITDVYRFGSSTDVPFRLADIVDVAWDGPRRGYNDGVPREVRWANGDG